MVLLIISVSIAVAATNLMCMCPVFFKKKQKQVCKVVQNDEGSQDDDVVQDDDDDDDDIRPSEQEIPILSLSNLKKSDNPSLEVMTLMKDVSVLLKKDDEWIPIFYGIETCRRLAFFHPEMIVKDDNIMHCLLLLVFGVSNLRSSLVRNALLCLQEWFIAFGMNMDKGLVSIIPLLLLRSGSDKKFIREAAHAALHAATQHCHGTVLLQHLLQKAENKTSDVLNSVAKYSEIVLEKVFEQQPSNLEFVDAVIVQLSKMISSSSLECRKGTKRCYLRLQKSLGVRISYFLMRLK